MSSLKVCDYVTVYAQGNSRDADGVYHFDIPNTYYTNQRSQVCTVEVTNGMVYSVTTETKACILQYMNGGINHYATGNLRPIIGNAQKFTAGSMRITPTGRLLCNARPNHISLKLLDLVFSGTPAELQLPTVTATNLNFVLTLKYSYYDSIETARELQREKTPHMM